MATVIIDIAMSLDGCVIGPDGKASNGAEEHILGWMSHNDRQLMKEAEDHKIGAMISGRGTYDYTNGWNGTHDLGNNIPLFVPTHTPPKVVPQGDTPFTFVTDGIKSTVEQARAAAGNKIVYVVGGANVIQQLVNERLFDELRLYLVPIFLGEGTRLFANMNADIELEQVSAEAGNRVANIIYRPAVRLWLESPDAQAVDVSPHQHGIG
jgi:dihydrofolate reductase